jgi:sialate O-acetylesterase
VKRLFPILIALMIASCTSQNAKLKLSTLISDHMVLQQNMAVALWGDASPGVFVTAEASWGEKAESKADENGKWKISLKTPSAGGPYTISFSTKKEKIVVNDILIGEVWLCSGQSNMEMPVKGFQNDTINFSKREIANAKYPQIRMFTVEKKISEEPASECNGSWVVCSPETVKEFSATAYFFGRDLNQKLNVPIGLIHTSWGGTPAEAWTSIDYLQKVPGYENVKQDLVESQLSIKELRKWLSNLDSIELYTIPADKSYSTLQLGDNNLLSTEFNDTSWAEMALPCLWENKGLPSFDGVVWYRKEFEIPKNLYPEGFQLHLGPVDDMDATYINGIKIGGYETAGYWNTERIYDIPQSALKEGKNTIAVRVTDTEGGGGIFGQTITINKGNKVVVNLSGHWKYLPTAVIYKKVLYKYDGKDKNYASMPKFLHAFDASMPSVLYNAMIAPLVPYTIKGAIWYQGEANVGRGIQYRKLLPTMIQNWRDVWQLGDFPFYLVQIAPFNYNNPSGVAELREAQLMTMNEKNTGMVVTMDLANPKTIHPGNKQDVGQRLALWALSKDYSVPNLLYCGPIYKSVSFEGNKAVVDFDFADSLNYHGKKLTSFEMAGADSIYYHADAIIKDNRVIVTSKKVKAPVVVRYAWGDNVLPNLFNKAGLPASPFRTKE